MVKFVKPGVIAALVVALALVPLFGNVFYTGLFTRIIIIGLAATSLNFILGYGGMVSLGHAAFIGIGAYAVGIPAYYGIYDGWTQLFFAAAVSALFALVTGAISLRTKGVHFIMITMAFAQMVYFLGISLEEYGGDDGLVVNARSDFGALGSLSKDVTLYYVSFFALMSAIALLSRIVPSRFGMVITGARLNDRRMRALGHHTYVYQLTAYVIAGIVAGIAGALLGNFTEYVSPDMMGWTRSGELIFMVILGGAGTLFGPLMGATVYFLLEHYLSGLWVYWHLIFGVLLILVVLYARGGLDGILRGRRGND